MNLNFYLLNKIEKYLILDINKEIKDNDFFLNVVAEIIKKDKIDLLHVKNSCLSTKKFLKILEFLKLICAELNTLLIIEDRIDVANATLSDGIFLPHNSFSVATARQFWSSNKILGVEIFNNFDEIFSEIEKIDYFIISNKNFDKKLLKNKICFSENCTKLCQGGNLVYLFRITQ